MELLAVARLVDPWRPPVPYGCRVRTIGNILWFVLAGFWLALGYAIAGVIACILIVTIPFGIASFRLAGYVIWPFGRTDHLLRLGDLPRAPDRGGAAVRDDHRHPIRNRLLEDDAARTDALGQSSRPDLFGGPRPVRRTDQRVMPSGSWCACQTPGHD